MVACSVARTGAGARHIRMSMRCSLLSRNFEAGGLVRQVNRSSQETDLSVTTQEYSGTMDLRRGECVTGQDSGRASLGGAPELCFE